MFRDRRQDRREERRGGTGATHYQMREKLVSIGDDYWIENDRGERVFKVITPFRQRWTLEGSDGPDLEVQGNIVDHEYRIEEEGAPVAEVSRRWFRVADTYGVEIASGHDSAFILAVTAA